MITTGSTLRNSWLGRSDQPQGPSEVVGYLVTPSSDADGQDTVTFGEPLGVELHEHGLTSLASHGTDLPHDIAAPVLLHGSRMTTGLP